jgi:endonuclease I
MKLFFVILLITQFHSHAQIINKSIKEQLYEQTSIPHAPIPYSKVKSLMFSNIDNINGIVCSAYTPSQCKERAMRETKTSEHFKMNIEHTWPQSKGAKEMPANSDMHHLFVTSKESNGKRANHPFCNAYYSYWEKDGSIFGFDEYSQDCFEPQDEHKGNVARSLFYFSIRYKMKIDADQERVLRQWNLDDPVDRNEKMRNYRIKELQGNLNPFILNSKLVNEIGDF